MRVARRRSAIAASVAWPWLITPFAHGVPMVELAPDAGFLAGAKQYKFMRAFYGLAVSGVIGIVVTPFTTPKPLDEIRGYVWGTVSDALARYKGKAGTESASVWAKSEIRKSEHDEEVGEALLDGVQISSALARTHNEFHFVHVNEPFVPDTGEERHSNGVPGCKGGLDDLTLVSNALSMCRTPFGAGNRKTAFAS